MEHGDEQRKDPKKKAVTEDKDLLASKTKTVNHFANKYNLSDLEMPETVETTARSWLQGGRDLFRSIGKSS